MTTQYFHAIKNFKKCCQVTIVHKTVQAREKLKGSKHKVMKLQRKGNITLIWSVHITYTIEISYSTPYIGTIIKCQLKKFLKMFWDGKAPGQNKLNWRKFREEKKKWKSRGHYFPVHSIRPIILITKTRQKCPKGTTDQYFYQSQEILGNTIQNEYSIKTIWQNSMPIPDLK